MTSRIGHNQGPDLDEPRIERRRSVKKPNGEIVDVNRFDWNLGMCGDRTRYIQCSDGSWLQIGRLSAVS